MDSDVLRLLEDVFAPLGAGPAGTATVLTSPSSLDGDMAQKLAEEVDLDILVPQIASIAALLFADALSAQSLRPADYASLEQPPVVLSERIAKLIKSSETFSAAFAAQLSMRG